MGATTGVDEVDEAGVIGAGVAGSVCRVATVLAGAGAGAGGANVTGTDGVGLAGTEVVPAGLTGTIGASPPGGSPPVDEGAAKGLAAISLLDGGASTELTADGAELLSDPATAGAAAESAGLFSEEATAGAAEGVAPVKTDTSLLAGALGRTGAGALIGVVAFG